MEIVGNLNKVDSYKDFLLKYLHALSHLGFVDTHVLFWLEDSPVAKNEQITLVFDELKEELKKLRDGISIDKMKKDVGVMMKFLEKNWEIINHPNDLREQKHSGIEIRMTDTSPHVDEIVEKLKNMPSENVSKAIEELYDNEKYSPAEIMDALEIWRKGK